MTSTFIVTKILRHLTAVIGRPGRGGKDSEEGVFDKSALPKFMRKQRHVTTQLLKLHTFLGLYSARVANAASFRGG